MTGVQTCALPISQGRLFHAFVQADSSTTRQFGGTGLGLAICARLVPLMGGIITLESAPGGGSTFSFTIDFSLSANGCDPVAASVKGLDGVRLLIVDDNPTARRALEEIAGRWGMPVETAASAPAGLARLVDAAALGQPFRAVLLDGQMPEFNDPLFVERFSAARAASGASLVMMLKLDRKSVV